MTADPAPSSSPQVFTIPAGAPFAVSLVRGLLARAESDPAALAEMTLLLPTRRACRTVRDAFLRLSGGDALLLPRMAAIGDVDADDMSLLHAGRPEMSALLDLPAAITPLRRQMLLARLIRARDPGQGFDQAVLLAQALGRFLDEVQSEGLDFAALETLVPDAGDLAEHWQQTLAFLRILTEHWPRILDAEGVSDAAARRTALVRAQIAAWESSPPQGPVIAAGTTGTTPAVADLLCLVARLPRGEVVLPGLDTMLDEDAWAAVGEDHPQWSLKSFLSRAGVSRADVRPWPEALAPMQARARWLSEAMRPAVTSEAWRRLTSTDIPPEAAAGLCLLECATTQEEADMIALLLREALETPGKTAALVTPDRRLARRVTQSLRRWGIDIDDTGGQPLTEIMAGSYLMALAEAAAAQLAPVGLLAFLKHPLTALALPPEDMRAMVYALDREVLRGPRPRPGLAGLFRAVDLLAEKRPRDGEKMRAGLTRMEILAGAFLAKMADPGPQAFADLLSAHIQAAEQMATTTDTPGAARLWRGEGGEAASLILAELRAEAAEIPPVTPAQYVILLGAFLKAVTVRPRWGRHPRLFIYGLIEARLADADRLVLGGLSEGTWPAEPPQDPWLSRPMRKAFGLPAPEKDVAQAAHDFVQGASAPEVFLTRAARIDGTPTVPSRWLLRMETVLQAAGLDWDRRGAARYRDLLSLLDKPAVALPPLMRPAPCPPVSARPRALSVTQVETWRRDPYQIYARHVLGLKKLDMLDADPGGAERGTFIHRALELFVRAFMQGPLPDDAAQRLHAIGRKALEELAVPPEVEAFWWPRFERIIPDFIAAEKARRQQAAPAAVELRGSLPWPDFTLKAKADRIDRLRDGAYVVVDYKSGTLPTNKEVAAGFSPQLPLEALMLREGAFPGLAAGMVAGLEYWRLSGGGQKPFEMRRVAATAEEAMQRAQEAEDGLRALVSAYARQETPYPSRADTRGTAWQNDYDHLARVAEWAVAADAEEEADAS